MAYTVTITNKYLKKDGKVIKRDLPKPDAYTSETIYSTMQPTGSYVDSVAYTNGYPNAANQYVPTKIKDGQFVPDSTNGATTIDPPYSMSNKLYERSIYATNHYDYGNLVGLDLLSAFAETLIPLGISFGQFAVSDVALGESKNTVTFTVEDYTAAFYYMTLAKQMEDQGIEIIVAEKASAADDSGKEDEPSTPEVGG